ncbi:universal stress protein [Modestobacter sp. NPDC049651]|uniref:universal stress protein n=1 Tax=unclassified Modestobacter TaxID=2643866 RepID=UPI00340108C5
MTGGTAGGTSDGGRAPVVVGVDSSAYARAALVWAVHEALRRAVPLEVVTAVPMEVYWAGAVPLDVDTRDRMLGDAAAAARALLAEVRAQVPAAEGLVATVVAEQGMAPAVLVDRSERAGLLVVGSRGRGGFRSTVLGSVALHCVSSAACPVVVVHGDGVPAGDRPVVVGVDGSARGRVALAAAVEQARRMRVAVEVVAAVQPVEEWNGFALLPPLEEAMAEARATTRAAVDELAAAADGDLPHVTVDVEKGAPAEVLLRRAADASLLVVGSRGGGPIRGMLLGSVALHCVVGATGPVLVVHPGQLRELHLEEEPPTAVPA